jgi:O-antigen ligase
LRPPKDTTLFLPAVICSLMVFILISRIQEMIPFLVKWRVALITMTGALLSAVFSGRIFDGVLWKSKETKLMIAFWLIGLLSVPLSVWPGGAFEFLGLVINRNFIVFMCCYACIQSERELKILLKGILLGGLTLGLGVVFAAREITEDRLTTTKAYDPNDLAIVLVMIMPLALFSYFSGKTKISKLFSGSTILFMVLAFFKTGSRGGFVGLAVLGLMFLFLRFNNVKAKKKVVIFVLSILLAIWIVPQDTWERFDEVATGKDYNLKVGRMLIWKSSLKLVYEKFLLGSGAGQFSTVLGQEYGDSFWRAAHNMFLEIAVELGLIGLLIFLLVIIQIWRNAKMAERKMEETKHEGYFIDFPSYIKLFLIGYVISGNFLSQGYLILLPILLAFSSSLKRFLVPDDKEIIVFSDEQGGCPFSYPHIMD